ncbi:MAG: flavin reductase family protein [Deltaproteobacteria bacterium]|nr:MAG: flavin reductase family protein [Deltaproteobacteria bacterium]
MPLKKRQLGPCVTFFPQPTTLIATVAGDGRPNLMTASWAGVVSKTPPTMAVSLNKGRLSYANIRQTGCFTVNVVPSSLAVEADYCGIRSGRDADKAEKTGLTLVPAEQVAAPLVRECPLNVECRLTGETELGDYRLVLGEIVQIHAAEEAFDEEGGMEPNAFDPLVYLGGIRQYWSLGGPIADAYRDGLSLDKKEPAED